MGSVFHKSPSFLAVLSHVDAHLGNYETPLRASAPLRWPGFRFWGNILAE